MRSNRLLAALVALVATAACTATMDEPMITQNMLFVTGPVSAGRSAIAVFRNSSGSALSVGDLPCAVDLQKSNHGGWNSVPYGRACDVVARMVRPGDSLTFTFTAPANSGVYRIQTTAKLLARSGTGQQVLLAGYTVIGSAPFVTTP
jgi:hypothetical protein